MKNVVFSFGEILWDLLPDKRVLGGAPFNFIYRVNSLGDTGFMISRLGNDDLGAEALNVVKKLGMDNRFIQNDPKLPTGTVKVSFDDNHNPDYVIIPRVAYDYIEPTEILIHKIKFAQCFCFGTLAQRSKTSRSTLEKLISSAESSLKFLDINLRKDCYSKETLVYSLKHTDILKLNEDEAMQLAEILNFPFKSIQQFSANIIEKYNLKYCLVTLAEKGAYAMSNNGEAYYTPGYKINLEDSLGAGDAFSAGFIQKILNGKSLQEACEFGNVLGAIVSTKPGATGPISNDEINNFIQQGSERNIMSDFIK